MYHDPFLMLHNIDNFKDSLCSIDLNQASVSPASLSYLWYKFLKFMKMILLRDSPSILHLLGSSYG